MARGAFVLISAQVERRSLSIRVRENLRERLRRLIAGELRSHEKLLVERNGYEGAELSAGGAHRRHLCGCRGRGSVPGAGSGVPSLNAELHVSVRRGNSSGGAAADGLVHGELHGHGSVDALEGGRIARHAVCAIDSGSRRSLGNLDHDDVLEDLGVGVGAGVDHIVGIVGDRGDRGDRDGLVILVNNIDVGLVVVGPEGSSILVAGVVETEDHAVRGDRTDLVAGRSTIEGRAEGVGVLHVGEAGDDVVLVLDDIVSGNEHLVGVVVETGGGDGGIDLNGGLLAVNDGGQDIVGAGGIGDDVGIGLLDKVGVNIGDTGEVCLCVIKKQ